MGTAHSTTAPLTRPVKNLPGSAHANAGKTRCKLTALQTGLSLTLVQGRGGHTCETPRSTLPFWALGKEDRQATEAQVWGASPHTLSLPHPSPPLLPLVLSSSN